MADEEKREESVPQEEKPVAEPSVTDADLASAYDSDQQVQEKVETEPKEEPEVKTEPKEEVAEPVTGEPTDNAERSRLGRRLKTIEEKFDAFLSKLENQQPQAKPQENVTYDDHYIQSQIDAAVERGELPATIVTPQDQYVVNRFVNGLQSFIGNKYAVSYINTLKSPNLKGDTPDDIHAEVVAELQNVESPFNLKRYNNPQLDAQLNYLEAKNSILQKKLSNVKTDKSVFKGKPPDAPPTGTSVSTRTTTAQYEMPKLDEASQDFIKRTGMSDESVAKALKSEMPYHLRGMR